MFSFFKPKWQHRNPKVRIEAIQQGDVDAALILSLAQNDSDISVRMEAFNKITNIKELYTLLLHEPSDRGKSAVLQQMLDVFQKSDHPAQTIQQFMQSAHRRNFPVLNLLRLTDDNGLKLIFISFLSRTSELQALIDTNYTFSLEEIKSMQDRSLLIYLAKNYKNADKKTVSYLKDVIRQLDEDEKKVAVKATLLVKYQALIGGEQLPALNVFSELENEWNALTLGDENKKYRDEYLARYHAYNQRRQQKLAELNIIEEAYKNKRLVNNQLSEIFSALAILGQEESFSMREKADIQLLIKQISTAQQDNQKSIESEKAANRVVKDVRSLLDKPCRLSDAELEKAKENTTNLAPTVKDRAELLNKINQRVSAQSVTSVFDEDAFKSQLQQLESLISEGELLTAMNLHEALLVSLKSTTSQAEHSQNSRSLRQISGALQDQMNTVRWGVFQGLEVLCEKAESLAQDSHTGEYISIMLKQLRDGWKESQKGIERVPHRLHQRFENACRQAHQKIVAIRNQDNNARAIYKAEAEGLLLTLSEYIGQIDWSSPKWNELLEMRQKFLQEWNRYLHQYSTDGVLSYGAPLFLNKDRNYFERSMRKILKPLESAIQKERRNEKDRRLQMIAGLKSLVDAGRIKEAVDQSKFANKNFTPTVRLPRHEENVLWKELRLVNDQVFALREEALSVEDSERIKNAEKKYELLKALNILLDSLNHESVISDIYQKLDDADNQWLEIGVVPKRDYHKLESEFREISNKIREHLQAILQNKAQNARTDIIDLSKEIGKLEYQALNSEPIAIDDDLLAVAEPMLKKRIKCLEQIVAGQNSALQFLTQKSENAAQRAKELVLLRDILLDHPLIEEEREERLAIQVKILENSMNNSENEKDKGRQLKRLDNEWLESCVGNISDALYQRFR